MPDTCGAPIFIEGELLTGQVARVTVGCTKRIGHATPPFKRVADKQHSYTATQDLEQRRL